MRGRRTALSPPRVPVPTSPCRRQARPRAHPADAPGTGNHMPVQVAFGTAKSVATARCRHGLPPKIEGKLSGRRRTTRSAAKACGIGFGAVIDDRSAAGQGLARCKGCGAESLTDCAKAVAWRRNRPRERALQPQVPCPVQTRSGTKTGKNASRSAQAEGRASSTSGVHAARTIACWPGRASACHPCQSRRSPWAARQPSNRPTP